MIRRHADRRRRGFVLIYVVAVLIFLTSLVLQASRDARGSAQLSARLQEQSATRERLRAAAILYRARCEQLWQQTEPAQRRLSLLAGSTAAIIGIDEVPVATLVTDADLLPDANLLMPVEWQRLLIAYGSGAGPAEALASTIEATRQQSGGFESMGDLSAIPGLPADLVRGRGEGYPPLTELLSAGGGSKRLHLSASPLALFAALLATSPDKLERFQELRKSRPLSLSDATALFGSEAQKLLYQGDAERLRIRMQVDAVPLRLEFEMWIRQGQLAMSPARMTFD